MLSGSKTYIMAALMAAAAFANTMGWITSEAYTSIMGILTAGGIAALRAGVAKK